MAKPESRFNGLNELYSTGKGTVYQDDQNSCFMLEFSGKKLIFKVQEFLHFKKCIDKINLEDLFLNELQADLQIIHHQDSDQLFLVTLCDLVSLKDLLAGAKVMLELNSIICSKLAPCKL